MRKTIIVPMLLVFLFAFPTAPAAAEEPPEVVVNGRAIRSDVPPRIVSGRTLVPLRFVSEALGVQVQWDEATRQVRIADDKHPSAEGALETFLAGQKRLGNLPNYRVDFDMNVTESIGGGVSAIGTLDSWAQGDSLVRGTTTVTLPDGVTIQAPEEVRQVNGQVYSKTGKQPWRWNPAPDPQPTDAERVEKFMRAVQDYPELVQRAFVEPVQGGLGRIVGVVLQPGLSTPPWGSPFPARVT